MRKLYLITVLSVLFSAVIATVLFLGGEVQDSRQETKLTPIQRYEKILDDIAREEGVTVEDIKSQVEDASSVYNYFLNRYLLGKLESIAEALKIVALSKNVEPFPFKSGPESIEHLRNDKKIVVKEIACCANSDRFQQVELCNFPLSFAVGQYVQ